MRFYWIWIVYCDFSVAPVRRCAHFLFRYGNVYEAQCNRYYVWLMWVYSAHICLFHSINCEYYKNWSYDTNHLHSTSANAIEKWQILIYRPLSNINYFTAQRQRKKSTHRTAGIKLFIQNYSVKPKSRYHIHIICIKLAAFCMRSVNQSRCLN